MDLESVTSFGRNRKMELFKNWQKMAYEPKNQQEYELFWNEYLPKEAEIYKYLLENKEETVTGTVSELAKKFNIDDVTFVGFIDGVNTSLNTEVDVNNLTSDSEISLDLNFEKLYFNMLDAKADWLYNLEQWNDIFTEEQKKAIKKEYDKTKTVVKEVKIGRNDPCVCGSGKKYKKCCGK